MIHLCNALHTLPGWYKLLENYGLLEPNKYPRYEYYEYDEEDVPRAVEPSWEEVKAELDSARNERPERLRPLCSNLLRRKDWHAARASDRTKFLDSLAQFETKLGAEGYRFDGFVIQTPTPAPDVLQLAAGEFYQALDTTDRPTKDRVW